VTLSGKPRERIPAEFQPVYVWNSNTVGSPDMLARMLNFAAETLREEQRERGKFIMQIVVSCIEATPPPTGADGEGEGRG
jgi:hypothetical protein